MKVYSYSGKLVSKNFNKYRVDWDKKSRSKIQFAVKQFLRPYWNKEIVYEEAPVVGTRMKIDFWNATRKICIEVDGNQHEQFNKHFHNNSRLNYLYSIRRDSSKEDWIEKNDLKLIRIKENEIKLLSEEWINEKFGFKIV